jgi:hypothetical protein
MQNANWLKDNDNFSNHSTDLEPQKIFKIIPHLFNKPLHYDIVEFH